MSSVTKNVVIAFKTTGEVSLTKSLKNANTELKLIESETKKAISSLSGFGQESKKTSIRIEEATKKIDVQKEKLFSLKTAYDQVVASQGKESTEAKKLKISMNTTESAINSLKNKLKSLKETGTDSFTKIDKEAGKTTKGFHGVGLGVTGILGALTGLGIGVKNTVSHFREMQSNAKKASMSFENFQVFSKIFTKLGIDTDTLHSSMSKLTNQIAKTDEEGDQATSTLSNMGISVRNANGEMRNSEDIWREAITYLAGMENQTERNMLAQQLFGRSYAELNPLLDLGKEKLKANIETMQKSGIITKEQGEKMQITADAMDKMDSTLTKLKNSLIAVVVPAVEPFLTQLAGWVGENTVKIQEWVKTLAGFFSTIAPYIPIILGLIVAFKGLMILSSIANGVVILCGALKSLEIGTALMTVAQWLLNAAMSANPIVIVVIAIAALIAALVAAYNNVGWFREGVDNACKAIGTFFSNVGMAIGNAISWAVNSAIGCFNWLVNAVTGICQSIGTFFSNVGMAIGNAISWAVNSAIGCFNWLVNAVKGIIGKITGFFGGIGDTAAGIIKKAINGVIGFVNRLIGGINSAIGGLNNIPGVNIGMIGQIGYMAKGGTLTKGMAIVGEAGPELLYNTSRGSKIIPLTQGEKKEGIAVGSGLPENITINLMDMRLVTKLKEKINEKNNAEYILASYSL